MRARLSRSLVRLRHGCSGSAMLEFALGLPLVLYMGGYGVELGNYALVNLKVNQISLSLADNVSRIGSSTGAASYNVREADINDLFQGARLMGAGISLTTYGRITISSLEYIKRAGTAGFANSPDDTAPVQRLHWQRCIGMRGQTITSIVNGKQVTTTDPGYDSSYGPANLPITAGTDNYYANRGVELPSGFGPSPLLNAPQNAAVIFVEINYQYHPLFGKLFVNASKIHYVASFIVRDTRDYTQLYNPGSTLGATATRATCNLYPV